MNFDIFKCDRNGCLVIEQSADNITSSNSFLERAKAFGQITSPIRKRILYCRVSLVTYALIAVTLIASLMSEHTFCISLFVRDIISNLADYSHLKELVQINPI